MPTSGKRRALPKPHTTIDTGRGVLRFFLGDSVEVLEALPPATVSVIVTSPPYNLGIRYRTYQDSLPREHYLQWSDAWIAAALGLDFIGVEIDEHYLAEAIARVRAALT